MGDSSVQYNAKLNKSIASGDTSKILSVMCWLDSLRYCARLLQKLEDNIKSIDEVSDGIGSYSIIERGGGSDKPDKIGQLLAKREEHRAGLLAEYDYLAPTVKGGRDFLVAAARQSDTPKEYKYLLDYYGRAKSLEQAAKASGFNVWQAKALPRKLAPALYQLEPKRFEGLTQQWGVYGYLEVLNDDYSKRA